MLPAITSQQLRELTALQQSDAKLPQLDLDVHHVLSGGMYARTVKIPAGSRIVGALVKKPTMVIIDGDVDSNAGRITGRHVIAGSPNRKQVFLALSDTYITAVSITDALTVREAEIEMVDDASSLTTNR